ncbi:MAG: DMT family transporter [Sedimentisphaerales bacterium]|nr:DMT family transporter [Sedimentisphaerales bacterium]
MNLQTSSKAGTGEANLVTIYLKLLLAALFWGGAFVAGRILKDLDHFTIAFLRFGIASVLLLALARKIEGKLVWLSGRQLLSVIFLGLTGVFAYNALFFKGLQTVEASRAALIIASCPVFIVISSALLLKEQINLQKALGIAMSVLGAAVVISRGRPLEVLKGGVGAGEFYMFCCVLSWTAYSLVGKAVMKDISPVIAVSYSATIGAALLCIPALASGMIASIPHYTKTHWLWIIYLAVFATVIGFLWYYEAIKSIGPVRAGLFINFVPIFGMLLAFFILREKITLSLAIGAVLVISGVCLTNRAALTRGR